MGKKNLKGGNKYKRGKKTRDEGNDTCQFAEEGQMYAKVLKRLGGLHLSLLCDDDKQRRGFIRGALRKRVWMNEGDILLVSTRGCSTTDDTCDIILRYTPAQAKKLLSAGQIRFEINKEEDDSGVRFDDDDESESDEENPIDREKKKEEEIARMKARTNKLIRIEDDTKLEAIEEIDFDAI